MLKRLSHRLSNDFTKTEMPSAHCPVTPQNTRTSHLAGILDSEMYTDLRVPAIMQNETIFVAMLPL